MSEWARSGLRAGWPTGAVLAAVVVLAGCGSSGTASKTTTAEQTLVAIGAGLQGPAGLHATVYATGLKLMSAFAFDERGRLWVTTSGASTHATDGLYLVPRSGAKPVRIAGKFRGPLGLVWVRGRLYVASLGRVEALAGLTGDRFASRRTILVGPPGSGENNNLVESSSGKLVMGVSASCDHCVPASKWSGSIVEFDTNGGGLRLFARRIRAPFGLVFYPGTDHLLATLNQRDDLGAKTPGDWLALVRDGDDFGFPACYGQAAAACSNVPSPLAVLDPHAAAGGVAVVRHELGAALGPAALVAEWALGKVLRVPLMAGGEQARGGAVPFLTGLKSPLPLIVAPDGALLVGDWTTGRIYRITRATG
jgi:glucose/arabinose dehydrogenase